MLTPPVAVPSGWTLQWTGDFAMALPVDWLAIDMSPDVVDAMIARMKEISPQMVPMLESAKSSGAFKFIAIDPAEMSAGYATNLNVVKELRLITNPDQYVEMLKKQIEPYGGSVMSVDKVNAGGAESLKLRLALNIPVAGGQAIRVEEIVLLVDRGPDRYAVTLAYRSGGARDFAGIFDQIAQSFRLLAPLPTPTPVASPKPPSTPTAQEIQALKEELRQIVQSAEGIRVLTTKTEVDYTFITSSELPARLLEAIDVAKEEAEAALDQELYVLLDLLPEGVDLFDAIVDAYTEAVVGFYDDDTKKMYVVSDTPRLDSMGKAVFVHEYTHALQDQYFDLGSLPLEDSDNADLEMAVRSLVEGDARLAEVMFLRGLSEAEMREFVERLVQMDTAKYDAIPRVVREQLAFPYEAGTSFVTALGGWDAINKAYTDLPQSTEQIMDPQKYLDGEEPVAVSLPDLAGALGAGWTLRDGDVLGQFGIKLYLEAYVDADTAGTAAAGWGGDRYAYLKDASNNKVLVLRSAWDSAEDAQEFFDAYVAFQAKKGNSTASIVPTRKSWTSSKSSVYLSKTESEVLLIIAPTDALATLVVKQFPEFQ